MRAVLLAGAHLAALWGFALAQPLFDLLSKNAEFFAIRGSTSAQIVGFALLVALVPPAVMLVLELLVGAASEAARRALHVVLVAALTALIAAQVLKRIEALDGAVLVALSLAVAVGLALLYARGGVLRTFLTALTPAPLVFVCLFLFFSPVSKLVMPADASTRFASVSGQTPVVVVIFDELPVMSLMNRAHEIDAARFPNFASLAANATWFRNTTTVHVGTNAAVPAIIDGRYPRKGVFPIYAHHKQSIFTLLGAHYRLNVVESITHLCPPKACGKRSTAESEISTDMGSLLSDVGVVYAHMVAPRSYAERLAPVTLAWGDFRRGAEAGAEVVAEAKKKGPHVQWQRWLAGIKNTRRPSLNLIHVLHPHGPWIYLPSCHLYGLTEKLSPARNRVTLRWYRNDWTSSLAFQRHMLQVQCTDRLLGQLLAKLRATGMYDRSLVAVVADHGVSFMPGEFHRGIDLRRPNNAQDIAFPIMFVKRPGQKDPAIVDQHVQTVDLVPTIADALGIKIPWRVDGRSAYTGPYVDRLHLETDRGLLRTPASVLLPRRERTLGRQLRLFGSGNERHGIYGLGPRPELIGKAVSSLAVSRSPARADLDDALAGVLRAYPPRPALVPTPLTGSVTGLAPNVPIAVAVNGRIAAVSRTWQIRDGVRFSIHVPESSFRRGSNRVELFAQSPGGGLATLGRLT